MCDTENNLYSYIVRRIESVDADRLICDFKMYNNGEIGDRLKSIKESEKYDANYIKITAKRLYLNRWYYHSYPIFLENAKLFISSENEKEMKVRITNMISNTGSWIAGIPKASIHDSQLIKTLHGTSKILSNFTHDGMTININNNKIIFSSREYKNININEYACQINTLINSSNKFNNFPTVTKFMHFINPNIFPIIDKHIKNNVFQIRKYVNLELKGNKNTCLGGEDYRKDDGGTFIENPDYKASPSIEQYKYYLQTVHKALDFEPLKALTMNIRKVVQFDISALRVMDTILFNEPIPNTLRV